MNLPPFIKGAEKVKVAVGKNGIRCTYENHHIIRLTLNFSYKPLDINDELGSDRYRSKVFNILQKNSHMYNGNNVVKSIWGYWPKEVTETNAYEMTLFYLIPTSSDLSKLRFEYDKSILGDTGGIFVFDKFADMEALEVEG